MKSEKAKRALRWMAVNGARSADVVEKQMAEMFGLEKRVNSALANGVKKVGLIVDGEQIGEVYEA